MDGIANAIAKYLFDKFGANGYVCVPNNIDTERPLSYDVASGKDITLCNTIDKPLVVYIFTGDGMTSVATLRK